MEMEAAILNGGCLAFGSDQGSAFRDMRLPSHPRYREK
jgi:hypothetical protein